MGGWKFLPRRNESATVRRSRADRAVERGFRMKIEKIVLPTTLRKAPIDATHRRAPADELRKIRTGISELSAQSAELERGLGDVRERLERIEAQRSIIVTATAAAPDRREYTADDLVDVIQKMTPAERIRLFN